MNVLRAAVKTLYRGLEAIFTPGMTIFPPEPTRVPSEPPEKKYIVDDPFDESGFISIQIDHVVIAGSDLDVIRGEFEKIGLTPDYGGVNADGLTHSALIGFADGSYLELIAPLPGKTASEHPFWESMKNDSRICAWAIRSNDIEIDSTGYRSRDIQVSKPVENGRTRPDGVQVKWREAVLESPKFPAGTFLPILIQDITPRELRIVQTKGTELITGISHMVIAESYPGASSLRHAFNIPDNRYEAYRSGDFRYWGKLPLNTDYWHGDGELNHIYGVALNVNDLDEAKKHYHVPNNIFRWHKQFVTWIPLKQTFLGLTGRLSRPTFDLELFKHRLAETIAWCAPRFAAANAKHLKDISEPGRPKGKWDDYPWNYVEDMYRTSVPKMPDTEYYLYVRGEKGGLKEIRELDEANNLRRSNGYETFFSGRSQKITEEGIVLPSVDSDLAGGRLLLFDLTGLLFEGAMEPDSGGFFREDDGPPWDTWVYYDSLDDVLIWWMPPEMLDPVQRGMAVMTGEWIRWLTPDEPYDFVKVLAAEGFCKNPPDAR